MRFVHTGGVLTTNDGQAPNEFAVAGRDRVFHPAQAVIHGDGVVVASDAVAFPQAVRFAWHKTARANLVNAAGLPAVPFRMDRWPLEHVRSKPSETEPANE